MKIAFVDSGMGGLVFAIDMLKNIPLSTLAGYNFLHVGDAENVPYGLKTPEVLTKITIELIQKSIDLGAKKVIVACNTACTILTDDVLKQFTRQGVEVFSIKNYTTNYVFNSINQLNSTLLILATKRTVQSKMYKNAIEQAFVEGGKSVNIIQHYPIEWEGAVELDFAGFNAKTLIELELYHIMDLMGEEKFSQITHVGLFCTHYPVIKNEVFNFASKYCKLKSIENIFSQGQAMSQIITPIQNSNEKPSITLESVDKCGKYLPLPTCIENYAKLYNINIVRR